MQPAAAHFSILQYIPHTHDQKGRDHACSSRNNYYDLRLTIHTLDEDREVETFHTEPCVRLL